MQNGKAVYVAETGMKKKGSPEALVHPHTEDTNSSDASRTEQTGSQVSELNAENGAEAVTLQGGMAVRHSSRAMENVGTEALEEHTSEA